MENLLLEQIELVKAGKFDDWILPAVINDFKKREKEDLENNAKRVERMRDAYLSFVDWEEMDAQISELEKVTKEDVVRVANQYYGKDYVVGFRIDEQHDLPSIEKPKIDPLKIDPDKQSTFMKEVEEIPYNPFSPKFIESGKDFQRKEIAKGVTLVHVTNPLNDLFATEVRMGIGNDRDTNVTLCQTNA